MNAPQLRSDTSLKPRRPTLPQRNDSLEYLSADQCGVCGLDVINTVISPQLLLRCLLPLPPLTWGGLR